MELSKLEIIDIIKSALQEDIGRGDITTRSLLSDQAGTAVITAREQGIAAGLEIAELTFKQVNQKLEVNKLVADGSRVSSGTVLAEVSGQISSILTGERVALNFLQRMSGIATQANYYQQLAADYEVRIVDTRKTVPGLRRLDKYAVRSGGAFNHRWGLDDAVLIKDNHLAAVGSITEAVNQARAKIPHTMQIEVEVEELAQVREALTAGADIIMLDNMELPLIKQAVKIIKDRAVIEASGGITADRLVEIAAAGVDIISIGELTHSVTALDIGLDIRGNQDG